MKVFTHRERHAIRESVAARCAGAIDSGAEARAHYDSAYDKFRNDETVMITMTKSEAVLLCVGLRAGIADDGLVSIGLTKGEQRKLADVGNALLDVAGLTHLPHYYGSGK